MIKTILCRRIYRNNEIITLKEAKEKYKWIHYDAWIKDNWLGIVRYNNVQFCDYNEFIPVMHNGEQLIQK